MVVAMSFQEADLEFLSSVQVFNDFKAVEGEYTLLGFITIQCYIFPYIWDPKFIKDIRL